MLEVANSTHERNSEDVSHLDTGEGNSLATGQIQVLDRDTKHALTVRAAFDPLSAMADEWMERARLIHVTDIGQTEDMAFARESRLGLRKVRSKIENLRKEMKADLVKRGRDIDGTATALEDKILPVEAHLREQEEFAIRYEAARLTGIREARAAELVALGTDPKLYTGLASVSDDGYAQILAIARAAHDAKAEAARLAEVAKAEEAQRIAEAQEAERLERARLDAERLERERVQAEENARLKAEAAERERVVEAERKARRVEQAERDRRDAIAAEALRIEREAAAAIAREKDEAARVEREKVEAALRVEREAREKAEREAAAERRRVAAEKEAREREEREKAEALAEAARQAALAPDREKLLAYAEALAAVPQPVLATTAGLSALGKIVEQVLKLVAGIRRLAGGL